MNQPGNHGMLQPNQQQHVTTLGYTDNGNQHLGNDPGGMMINRNHNVVQNQMSMPPSPWGKCPSQPSQGNIGNNNGMMTSGDIHHSSSVSPSNNSFGASSFNPYQSDQQQQHCFYPNSAQHQIEMRYNNSNSNPDSNNGMTAVSQMRPNTASGYPHSEVNNSAGGFYDTDERDCRQYYPNMDQHHQGAAFSYDQQNQMKSNGSSCAMMSGHAGGGNSNFYGYYNTQNSQYSHQSIYNTNQLNGGTSDESDFSDRTHHNNANRYFDQNPHSSNRQDPNSQGYFNPSNYGTTSQCGRYSNSSSSPYSSHHHGHHPPFRRKSMESYISEPGDVRYNSKYGCPNFSAPTQSQSPSQYCSPAPSPSLTMIKRECMSNPSSSIPTPPMSANSNCSGWTRNTNSEDIQMQSDPVHHSQDYLYTNTNSNSHQNQSGSSNMNMNYNNNVNIPYNQSQSSNENNDSFHQQEIASLKSCIFELNDKGDNELKNVNNVGGFGVKAATVKHRSLSLSVPSSSSSYPRNDIIGLSQQGNFTGHEHPIPNTNDCNSTSGDYNSTQKVSESVSTYSMKTDSPHEQFANYTNSPITELDQSVTEFIHKPEECIVSSCNENVEDMHHQSQVDAFSVESVEKVDENGVGSGGDGGGESPRESNCDSVGSVDLCPSSNHCDDEISNTQTSLLDGSPFGDLPDTDTEMVASEKSFEMEKPGPEEEDLKTETPPAASNVISTTTTEISSAGGNECDPDSESNSSNNSNCSFSSALFGKRANSISCNFSSDDNDNESCASGGSFTFGGSHHNTRNNKMSPQKIAKRSFSETDKDMVINTTAISFGLRKNGGNVVVPKGWKREVSYSNEDNHMIVYYVSPSDTKLRSWDELKNYICSDGTCKCGLSCPLRLESAFNFDPKVISLCVGKEEDLMYLNESEESSSQQHQNQKSTLCNHYKRKIPKSEDSPLISSTRDDLGDCPEKRSKKRRTSESEFSTGNPGNATPNSKESPLPSSVSRHVAVPCSQQSPDTTTQTPQTGMSPASSVSSEPSSGTGFNSTGGSRSLTSTPTPPSSSGKVSTPPGSKRQPGQSDFVWPPPPSTQSPSLSSPSNNNNISWTSPSVTSNNTSNASKKPPCHHLIPKGNKRANSPCPNIDVRQIPLEQNRPPPKPGIDTTIQTLSTATTVTPSQPTFNANFSFFPVTSAPNEMLAMNLNSGFTISPIVQTNTGNTMTVFSTPQISQALPSTNMSCTIPLEIQKIINPGMPDQTNAFIPQFQPPVVLSVVGQPQQITTRADESVKDPNSGDINKPMESSVEKSPLQLVQDVVNRFESKAEGESCSKDGSMENEKRLQISTNSDKGGADSGDKIEKPKSETSDDQSSTTCVGDKVDGFSTLAVNVNETNSATLPVQDLLNKAANSKAEVTIKTEPKVDAGTTVVNTTTVSIAPMDHSTVTVPTCITSMGNTISTFTVPTSTTQQIILQAPQTSEVQTTGGNFITSTGQQATRYPIIQTIQPFFLNQAGGTGGPFIISPQSQTHQTDSITQQSFIYHDPQISHQQHNPGDHGMQSMLHPTTTMLFDPSMCANNPNFGGAPGGKKKKKRLSKKQQQQQAQLQLQQQLLLQQIHQAQQQQAAAAYTIFPQSFNLGPQGFSLQPMNFFQTPTILTLPNLILNPADGTLFLQPSGQLSTTANPVQNTVKFPLTTTTTLTPSQPQQIQQHPNPIIAPKKDNGTTIINVGVGGTTGQILEVGKAPSDAGSDDSRRNPTPDSSTGDIQLGILNASSTNHQPGNTIISIAPHPTTTTIMPATNKKVSTKSRAVSSSSTVKRIFPQKQILPKIDSTTPSIENN